MESPSALAVRLDRLLKGLFREVSTDVLSRDECEQIVVMKKAIREIKLDVRDYSYAMSREEQLKWAKIAKHNLSALNVTLLKLGGVIGAVDTAELSALIETLNENLE